MILAVDCPECGQQVDLRAVGPDGILDLPVNLWVESLLQSFEQEVTSGAGDKGCSKCKTIGSTSECRHCLQVNKQHVITTYR